MKEIKLNSKTIKTIAIAVHFLTTTFITNQVQAEQKANVDFKLTTKYIKKLVEKNSFDETSLKWREIKISNNGKYGCATFNGKNRLGSYSGYNTAAVLVYEDNTVGLYADSTCYEQLADRNYEDSPKGRADLERRVKADEKNKKLKALDIAQKDKRAKQDEEKRLAQAEEDSKRRETESIESEKNIKKTKSNKEKNCKKL